MDTPSESVAAADVLKSSGQKLFLLDGMALVYRAHFSMGNQPIRTADGRNTTAVFGFANTLLDLITRHSPHLLAVVFDTSAPTARHHEFKDYKAQREEMPEELSLAIPHVKRLIKAFNLPVLELDGYEADDIIGTLAKKAEPEGFITAMVTPDKDFGQLVTNRTIIYRPSRMGDGVELLGVPEVLAKWGVSRVDQVIDILGLWGDTSDNIPGVPGIGEKTAQKLISQFGSVEGVLANTAQLKGKQKEAVEANRDQALMCKRLATIDVNVPIAFDPQTLQVGPRNDDALKELFAEMEFNSLGKRLFGDDFKAGRGFGRAKPVVEHRPSEDAEGEGELDDESSVQTSSAAPLSMPTFAKLRTIADVSYKYGVWDKSLVELISHLAGKSQVGLAFHHSGDSLLGLSFAEQAGRGWYMSLKQIPEPKDLLDWLESGSHEWVGHNLKPGLRALALTLKVSNPVMKEGASLFYDTALVHALICPDLRHNLELVTESLLGYTPMGPLAPAPQQDFFAEMGLEQNRFDLEVRRVMEEADLAFQLKSVLDPLLAQARQGDLYRTMEGPLMPVLATMEAEGILLDPRALIDVEAKLKADMIRLEKSIFIHAGTEFKIGSPKQMGDILFGKLALMAKAKKTKTGQFATDERTLQSLAPLHPIINEILEHREASKLLSTYVEALPKSQGRDGRIRTTFYQLGTTTGRLNSQDPNLQNIPIRTAQGREIRRAFVPREGFVLMSADYSQIELRILAALAGDPGLMEAITSGQDIHTATAAKVYGIPLDSVTKEQRSKAKMVNYGISYGMSAFGLAQRLTISRGEAKDLIDGYFRQYPGIRHYMLDTVRTGAEKGYVETITGRRRFLPDLRSGNATVRGAAERNAINMPIQGSSADLIKLAMIRIAEIAKREAWKSRLLLQVHDELVFELAPEEKEHVAGKVEDCMKNAMPELKVPIVVEVGFGANWLEAH